MTSVPPPGARGRWGAYSLNPRPVPQPGGGPEYDQLPRRLLQVAAGLSVLLLLVIANYALNSDENPFNPIAEAATRTEQMTGARSAIQAIYSWPKAAKQIVASGGGVYNARTGRSRLTLSVPSARFGGIEVEAVGDERTVYMRSDEIYGNLPPGRDWIGFQPLLGYTESTAMAGNGDPRSVLEMLRAVDEEVESQGIENVRGVPSERYSGSIDYGHYAELLRGEGKAPLARVMEATARLMPEDTEVEVWIDGQGIVRRTRMVMTMPTSEGEPPLTMDMRIELFDFGIEPEVRLPDQDRVFDTTPLLRAELDLFEGTSLGPLRPQPAAPALSAASLRERANAICAGLFERTAGLRGRAESALDDLRRVGENSDAERIADAMRTYSLEFMEPLVPALNASLRRLARLAPPPPLAGPYSTFLRESVRGSEMFEAMARALEVGQLKLADSLDEKSDPVSDAADRAARQIGLDKCIEDEYDDEGGGAPV
jgi:hypothetical protein